MHGSTGIESCYWLWERYHVKKGILVPGSTVVEHLTHNHKIQGSNPATGFGRYKNKQDGCAW